MQQWEKDTCVFFFELSPAYIEEHAVSADKYINFHYNERGSVTMGVGKLARDVYVEYNSWHGRGYLHELDIFVSDASEHGIRTCTPDVPTDAVCTDEVKENCKQKIHQNLLRSNPNFDDLSEDEKERKYQNKIAQYRPVKAPFENFGEYDVSSIMQYQESACLVDEHLLSRQVAGDELSKTDISNVDQLYVCEYVNVASTWNPENRVFEEIATLQDKTLPFKQMSSQSDWLTKHLKKAYIKKNFFDDANDLTLLYTCELHEVEPAGHTLVENCKLIVDTIIFELFAPPPVFILAGKPK
jgi:hypothetical protein